MPDPTGAYPKIVQILHFHDTLYGLDDYGQLWFYSESQIMWIKRAQSLADQMAAKKRP